MTDIIVPIDPSKSIKRHAQRVEPTRNVSAWFLDEVVELDFGDSVGRPNENVILQKEYITRFLENGWTIDRVVSTDSGGTWESVSKSVQASDGSRKSAGDTLENIVSKSNTDGRSTSNTTQNSDSNTVFTNRVNSAQSSSSYESSSSDSGGTTKVSESDNAQSQRQDQSTVSSSRSTQSNESENSQNYSEDQEKSGKSGQVDETSSVANVETHDGGAAFWYVRQRIRMRRRRMQPEKVLQDMVTSFTDEYNSGRKIDSDRFDEMVSLYGILLKSNEKEGTRILSGAVDAVNPTSFLDSLYGSIWSDMDSARKEAMSISDDAEKGAVDDVNRSFDALVSQARAQMVSNGTYNAVVWASVSAGIERQRAAALVKARSEARQVGVGAISSVGSAKASAASVLLAARNAISDSVDKRRVTMVEMRNNVIKWMLDFIGRREEVYPELEEISACAERLGFSVGAAGNVL